MRNEHLDQVERWANYVKDNPDKWKKTHTEFINSQFVKHKKFIIKILRKPDGPDKIRRMYNINNLKIYKKLSFFP